MTMILQQSATFERKSDGAISIQCSVCFFSGFSTCHCSGGSGKSGGNSAGSAHGKKQSKKAKSPVKSKCDPEVSIALRLNDDSKLRPGITF